MTLLSAVAPRMICIRESWGLVCGSRSIADLDQLPDKFSAAVRGLALHRRHVHGPRLDRTSAAGQCRRPETSPSQRLPAAQGLVSLHHPHRLNHGLSTFLSPAVEKGFRATYEVITAESCEAGDASDRGWLDGSGMPQTMPGTATGTFRI